jgi:hypothetical protein
MSNPTANLRTAQLIAGMVALIQACPEVSEAEIPVISGHDMQDLEAGIEKAIAAIEPGIFISVAATSGKPSAGTPLGKGEMRWVDSLQVDITANPMVQSASLAALDLKDILEDYLQGAAPVSAPKLDRERKLSLTEWSLSGRDPQNGLLTYTLQMSVVVSNDFTPPEE